MSAVEILVLAGSLVLLTGIVAVALRASRHALRTEMERIARFDALMEACARRQGWRWTPGFESPHPSAGMLRAPGVIAGTVGGLAMRASLEFDDEHATFCVRLSAPRGRSFVVPGGRARTAVSLPRQRDRLDGLVTGTLDSVAMVLITPEGVQLCARRQGPAPWTGRAWCVPPEGEPLEAIIEAGRQICASLLALSPE